LVGAFGGLFASGILKLDRIGSVNRWRMIFVVEGIITAGLGLIALVFLTDSPSTARWLSEEEKQLAIDRVKIERLHQSQLVDKMNRTRIKRGVLNPATLATAAVFMLNNVVALGIAFFLPTVIRTIYPGRTVVQLQLLSVPPYVVAAACLLTAAFISSRIDNRQLFLVIHSPLVLVGYAILLSSFIPGVRYAAIFLTAATIYIAGPFSNAQVSANTVSDTSRNIGISVNSQYPIPHR
jgi:sugar phosphate permease